MRIGSVTMGAAAGAASGYALGSAYSNLQKSEAEKKRKAEEAEIARRAALTQEQRDAEDAANMAAAAERQRLIDENKERQRVQAEKSDAEFMAALPIVLPIVIWVLALIINFMFIEDYDLFSNVNKVLFFPFYMIYLLAKKMKWSWSDKSYLFNRKDYGWI